MVTGNESSPCTRLLMKGAEPPISKLSTRRARAGPRRGSAHTGRSRLPMRQTLGSR
jgi:hypothetical protein